MLLTFTFSLTALAQNAKVFTLSGKVIEKSSNQPLEFASIYVQNQDKENIISGGMTNEKGEFNIDVPQGVYYLKVDFLGFLPIEKKNISVLNNTNIGILSVEDDAQLLDDVVVIAQASTVEIKLDKNKKYYIGLEFEPSDNCKKFIFQAVNSKNLTTIIDSKIIKSTTSNTYRDVGIRYRIYYK